jgi:20S proteasome subunit beta 7
MNGGSVIALKYDGGVLMAADTLLSYGSLAKQPNVPRIRILGNNTAVCCSGDYADFNNMFGQLQDLVEGSRMEIDMADPKPQALFAYLHRTVYHQRCEFDPFMCKFVMAGVDPATKESFVGACDSIGTKWFDDCAAAGMAAHNALPLMRRALEVKNGRLSRAEAMAVIEDACRVIFYRECRAINRFQVADVTAEKTTISEPKVMATNFEFDGFAFDKTALIK